MVGIILIIIAVVVIITVSVNGNEKRVNNPVPQHIEQKQEVKEIVEQDDVKKQETAKKMAELREKKLKKKQEEAKRLAEEKIENEKKREIENKKREENKQCLIEDLKALNISFEYKPIDGKHDYYICIESNEHFDISKFYELLLKYNIVNDGHFAGPQFNEVNYLFCYGMIISIKCTSGNDMEIINKRFDTDWSIKEGDKPTKEISSFSRLKKIVDCFCSNERLKTSNLRINDILKYGVEHAHELSSEAQDTTQFCTDILLKSNYFDLIKKELGIICKDDIALIEYELPNRDSIDWTKEHKYVSSDNSIKTTMLPEATIAKNYENLLYSICLRSVYELSTADKGDKLKAIVFNGFVTQTNKATGHEERRCILSLQVSKEKILTTNLASVDAKLCFKSFKGVSAAKLIDITPIQPVLTFNKNDKRFIDGRDIKTNTGTNLASMDWEEFEHLVRELFELEFSKNGGDVKVTQASRDGGVDAIAFDPDPIRGGKIVIQAKRYTNTVGVAAVRDLYGTVINEGANTGILITTSDYGHDSYEFAKDKPLKLLNGGHLLALLQKNGMKGYINIQEAKELNKEEAKAIL